MTLTRERITYQDLRLLQHPPEPERNDDATVMWDILGAHRGTSELMVIGGRRGKGKTLFMTILAYEIKRLFPYIKLVADYNLTFGKDDPSIVITKDVAAWLEENPTEINMLILIDELMEFMDRRRSLSRINSSHNSFANQIRKRNSLLVGTMQNLAWADSRAWFQFDVLLDVDTPNEGRTLYLDYWDKNAQYVSDYTVNFWPPDRPPDALWTFNNAHLYWHKYNTYEVVERVYKRSKQRWEEQPGPPLTAEAYELFKEMLSLEVGPFAFATFWPSVKEATGLSSARIEGLLRHQGYKIRTIDGVKMVMPPK